MKVETTIETGVTVRIDSAMTHEDYEKLVAACDTKKMPDEKAREHVCWKFGFDPKRTEIISELPLSVYVGSMTIKPTSIMITRAAVWNATDWNYIRFRICGQVWECVNGHLEMIAE